jgi:hypothetical protein
MSWLLFVYAMGYLRYGKMTFSGFRSKFRPGYLTILTNILRDLPRSCEANAE